MGDVGNREDQACGEEQGVWEGTAPFNSAVNLKLLF